MNRGTSIDSKWETTGGAALAGDDSLTAALHETKEESSSGWSLKSHEMSPHSFAGIRTTAIVSKDKSHQGRYAVVIYYAYMSLIS